VRDAWRRPINEIRRSPSTLWSGLSVYRRKLEELGTDEVEYIHSHELAALVGVTPAQLRRDLASFGSYGQHLPRLRTSAA